MKQICLQLEDDYVQKFMELLKALPENKIYKTYTYTDDLGDLIEVKEGVAEVIASTEDVEAIQAAQEGGIYTLMDIKNARRDV
ncbi:hypothetical protein QUF61_00860 [Candidatus Venteria ishoeyi]|uniref:hypothetical protein n=1 Tax=Candidatus Venteria ishoeyi TaxID=1899563 RepID=UPI0025A588A0|nr:hypothetical protein [Candidatus Venteria ishoeyi]MDM8545021.1 hypothetical protein [Candidatus Venteria ishoeyi]